MKGRDLRNVQSTRKEEGRKRGSLNLFSKLIQCIHPSSHVHHSVPRPLFCSMPTILLHIHPSCHAHPSAPRPQFHATPTLLCYAHSSMPRPPFVLCPQFYATPTLLCHTTPTVLCHAHSSLSRPPFYADVETRLYKAVCPCSDYKVSIHDSHSSWMRGGGRRIVFSKVNPSLISLP